jgi:hypothetical protein
LSEKQFKHFDYSKTGFIGAVPTYMQSSCFLRFSSVLIAIRVGWPDNRRCIVSIFHPSVVDADTFSIKASNTNRPISLGFRLYW